MVRVVVISALLFLVALYWTGMVTLVGWVFKYLGNGGSAGSGFAIVCLCALLSVAVFSRAD